MKLILTIAIAFCSYLSFGQDAYDALLAKSEMELNEGNIGKAYIKLKKVIVAKPASAKANALISLSIAKLYLYNTSNIVQEDVINAEEYAKKALLLDSNLLESRLATIHYLFLENETLSSKKARFRNLFKIKSQLDKINDQENSETLILLSKWHRETAFLSEFEKEASKTFYKADLNSGRIELALFNAEKAIKTTNKAWYYYELALLYKKMGSDELMRNAIEKAKATKDQSEEGKRYILLATGLIGY